ADLHGGFDVLGSHTYREEGEGASIVVVTGRDGTTYSSGGIATQVVQNVKLLQFQPGETGATANDYLAIVQWGDGTSDTITSTPSAAGRIVADPSGGLDVVGSHNYAVVGKYTVHVDVHYVAQFSANQFVLNELYRFTSTDPNATAGDFTATVNWGDGHSNSS